MDEGNLAISHVSRCSHNSEPSRLRIVGFDSNYNNKFHVNGIILMFPVSGHLAFECLERTFLGQLRSLRSRRIRRVAQFFPTLGGAKREIQLLKDGFVGHWDLHKSSLFTFSSHVRKFAVVYLYKTMYLVF